MGGAADGRAKGGVSYQMTAPQHPRVRGFLRCAQVRSGVIYEYYKKPVSTGSGGSGATAAAAERGSAASR